MYRPGMRGTIEEETRADDITPEGAAGRAAALLELARMVHTLARREAGRERLSTTQADLLAAVVELGPSRVSALVRTLRRGAPTLSEAADALVQKGLLRKMPDPSDRRASLLVPTMRGRRIGTRTREVPPGLERSLAALPPPLAAALDAALLRAHESLVEELVESAVRPRRRSATQPAKEGGLRSRARAPATRP